MSEWKEYKVSEIAEVVGGGTPKTEVQEYWNGNIPWITPRDLSGYTKKYISKGERNITELGIDNSNARLLPKGAVLMSSRAPIGYLAIAKNLVSTNQGFQSLIPNEKTTTEFLYYLLKNNVDYLISNGSGTTFGELSKSTLKELVFRIPSLIEQSAIAEVLSCLDDKIDLLHRQNKTLEQIAETLFRQWFVEEAEEGWEEKGIDDIAEFLNGLACQKYPVKIGEVGLPVIKIKELRTGITAASDIATNYVPEKYIVNDGDMLFSWSGSLDILIWSGGKGVLNQHLFKVSSDVFPQWFYYYWVKYHLPEFQGIAEDKATTMGHIQRHHLTGAKVLVPPKNILEEMNELINPIFEKIKINQIQIRTLTKLRDILLSKLMSGEAKVKI